MPSVRALSRLQFPFFAAEVGDVGHITDEQAAPLLYHKLVELVDSPPAVFEEVSPEIPVSEEVPEEEPKEVKQPYGNANKDAWIEYAVYKGGDPEELQSLTKAEIQSRYGGRL